MKKVEVHWTVQACLAKRAFDHSKYGGQLRKLECPRKYLTDYFGQFMKGDHDPTKEDDCLRMKMI